MTLEEAILNKIRKLPPDEQAAVLRFADQLNRENRPKVVPVRDRTREAEWLAHHRVEYAGQWVAVEGDQLIASGPDPLPVYTAAQQQGVQTPFIVHVLPEDSLPFVPGW